MFQLPTETWMKHLYRILKIRNCGRVIQTYACSDEESQIQASATICAATRAAGSGMTRQLSPCRYDLHQHQPAMTIDIEVDMVIRIIR